MYCKKLRDKNRSEKLKIYATLGYILKKNCETRRSPAITVAGVVEVKSYKKNQGSGC
jgi:hypothetical protein